MAIDYQKVLENPEVLAWAQAACPDYQGYVDSDGEAFALEQLADWLPDNLLEHADQVLCLAWDGDFPGNSGALYVQETKGMFFISSSDYEPSGPYLTLDEVLDKDYFEITTPNPELSGSIPHDLMILVAAGVCDEDSTILINDVTYLWHEGKLVPESSV